jgi:DNA-binding response OmpR family regulator
MKKILIVDDNFTVAEVAKIGLEATYDVAIAYIGATAIEIIERERPDLIILDYNLGKSVVTSFDVARVAQQFGIQVLILSGVALYEDAVKFNLLGVHEFMEKPYSFPMLVGRVQGMIGE